MSVPEIERVAEMFRGFDLQVILVRRDIRRYLSSTWRHAVFRHDYGESFETFLDRFKDFSFGNAETKFRNHLSVHAFDMEAPDYAQSIGALLGTTVDIPRANVGVPLELAELLQRTHVLLGSEEFRKRFDARTKAAMLAVWNGERTVDIEPMDAPLF